MDMKQYSELRSRSRQATCLHNYIAELENLLNDMHFYKSKGSQNIQIKIGCSDNKTNICDIDFFDEFRVLVEKTLKKYKKEFEEL